MYQHTQLLTPSPETILVADDEPIIVQIIAQVLESMGYEVLTANNGQEAVAAAESFPRELSLAILDVNMPVMDGPSAAMRLKDVHPESAVVFCSGSLGQDLAKAIEEVGADGFIEKPFDLGVLVSGVRRLLQARRRAQKRRRFSA